jgi:hypothetical protein
MARWICPHCDREFDRAHQSHTCVPGGTVDATFAGRPDWQREAYERMVEHLDTLGLFHVDSVSVGVFLKSDRKFAEIRPKARGLTVLLMLSRPLADARVGHTERLSAERFMSTVRLTDPDQVDDVLCGWLTEAYEDATDAG